jgi:hypothetical protein
MSYRNPKNTPGCKKFPCHRVTPMQTLILFLKHKEDATFVNSLTALVQTQIRLHLRSFVLKRTNLVMPADGIKSGQYYLPNKEKIIERTF